MEKGRTITGIVTGIIDCGSIVQVFINDAPWAADGNMWRRGGASDDIEEGTEVEAVVSDWGGLLSIEVA